MKTLENIRIGVIGDDLTGVNTVVGEAAMFGVACCVTVADELPPDEIAGKLQVWGINLASRDRKTSDDRGNASRQTERLIAWGADHILFKIDSLWRGNPELLVDCAGQFGSAILFNGNAPSSDISPQAKDLSLQIVLETNPLLALQDFRRGFARENKLWVGSVGVLKSILWSHVTEPIPIAIVVGSYQENIDRQVDALGGLGAAVFDLPKIVDWPVAPRKVAELRSRLNECWNQKRPIVLRTIVGAPTGSRDKAGKDGEKKNADLDRAEIYFALCAELLREFLTTTRFGLVLTGGHTANSVLTSLGLKTLVLDGRQTISGAPVVKPINEGYRRGFVVTKPGHYGGADALVDITMCLQIYSETPVLSR